MPWQLYASSRTTRIIARFTTEIGEAADPTAHSVIHALPDATGYTSELERLELFSLLFAMISPGLGVMLLMKIQTKMDISLDYLNSNTMLLFVLASLVKPIGHLHQLLLARATYLQSKLHFPEDLLTELRLTAASLTTRLTQLEKAAVSAYELKLLKKNFLDTPVEKLSRTLAQQLEADEQYQRRSAEEAVELARVLSQLEARLASTAATLDAIGAEQVRLRSSPVHTLAQMFVHLARAIEPKQTPTVYVDRLPSDSETDEDERELIRTTLHNRNPGTVEFIPRTPRPSRPRVTTLRVKNTDVGAFTEFANAVPWPLSIWIRLAQLIWTQMQLRYNRWVWSVEPQARYERVSEFNSEQDRSMLLNQSPSVLKPSKAAWVETSNQPTSNGHIHSRAPIHYNGAQVQHRPGGPQSFSSKGRGLGHIQELVEDEI